MTNVLEDTQKSIMVFTSREGKREDNLKYMEYMEWSLHKIF
jgi:hypothetical protein